MYQVVETDMNGALQGLQLDRLRGRAGLLGASQFQLATSQHRSYINLLNARHPPKWSVAVEGLYHTRSEISEIESHASDLLPNDAVRVFNCSHELNAF